MKVSDETMLFRKVDDEPMTAEEVLTRVYKSIIMHVVIFAV